MKRVNYFVSVSCFVFSLFLVAFAAVVADPLVIVVHGIGGGNRDYGWSREISESWGVPVQEVTFRYEGRTALDSYLDFIPKADDWALSVQSQIREIVRQNPGRRVMIVSHSWGTVVTKMALEGGATDEHVIEPIQPTEFQVEEWVTLGSPLGPNGTPLLAGTLISRRLDVPSDRPKIVKHWTNFYDLNDLVSSKSQNLPGADNRPVNWGRSPLEAHTGIWTVPEVRKHVWDQSQRISDMGPINTGDRGDVEDVIARNRQKASGASPDDQVVAEYRALLPQVLQKNKKPWHTRINIIANADKQGDKYHVNYQTYCLIESGPDAGKDHMCFEFETMLDLAGIRAAVADMKGQLGR